MTIVYNQSPSKVMWNVPDDAEDMEREYKGRTLRRDKFNSRYWLIDGMRFVTYKNATDYIDQTTEIIDKLS